jgi:protein gp37
MEDTNGEKQRYRMDRWDLEPPWQGCIKISDGCKRCYMYAEKRRYGKDPRLVVRSKTTFRDPLKWTTGQRIFTCSWSDFFIEQADAWRDEAWDIIWRTPQHTYQILTKRPERIEGHLPQDLSRWPWSHVWLGVTIESPAFLGRADILRSVPVTLRFLSCEPLLADLGRLDLMGIGWVIAGAESERGARPMDLDWVRSVRDQCLAASVPFFFKQAATPSGRKIPLPELDGRRWAEVPQPA